MCLSQFRANTPGDKRAQPLRVADVIGAGLSAYGQKHKLPAHHWKVLNAIVKCRTPELGGQVYRCERCGKEHTTSLCCGNRHCPSCQSGKAIQWLEKQQQALLPVPYFHLVFTLPHILNPLICFNQALLYKLLFECASETLLHFGQNRFGGKLGITAVLHTWSQQLGQHYHVHCIVTAGAFNKDQNRWTSANPKYSFPVRALSKVFRANYRDGLWKLFDADELNFPDSQPGLKKRVEFRKLIKTLMKKKGVVYAKPPFGGPEQVLRYLCRYTHRVAISDSRIIAINHEQKTVEFSYRDYADGSKKKTRTLPIEEFIDRFRFHILPPGFCKIRHYGILANAQRKKTIEHLRSIIKEPVAQPVSELAVVKEPQEPIHCCPHCGHETTVWIRTLRKKAYNKSKQPSKPP